MKPFSAIAIACAMAAVCVHSVSTQGAATDVEGLLASRFGFTPAEIAQARGGQAVSRLMKSDDAVEIGAYGAVRIDAKADRLVYWLKDVENFRKAAEIGTAHRVSDPPAIGDFANLSLEPSDVAALRACRPGKCDLRIGDKAIAQFQAIDWNGADATRSANLLMRQLLLAEAQAYLKGGDQALGTVHNDKAPRARADEFHQVLFKSKGLYDLAQPFAAYLEQFPAGRPDNSEQFLFWAKNNLNGETQSITLHQLVVYKGPAGNTIVADKQLFASRDVDAALAIITLAPSADGNGFWTLVGARARTTLLSGMTARMLRGTIERGTRDTVKMYLDWVRASMAGSK